MNIARRLWRLARIYRHYRAADTVLPYMPIRLWIDTSSRCNLRCVMCPNKDLPPAEKGNMSLELFRKIIDEARHFVQDVNLHHRGEPLLNPELPAMIRYAREAGLRVRFHSNGTLLDADRTEGILEACPDLISFSIDGFEKEAYEVVRIGATFEKTQANVEHFLRRRRERGQRLPYVVIERIHFRDREEPEHVRASAAEVRRRFVNAGADEVIDKAEYDWAVESTGGGDAPRTYSRCTFAWYAMVISWDGVVTPCPQDFYTALKMGNAATQSLAEIWNGPEYQRLRRSFSTPADLAPICRGCDRLCRKTIGGRLPSQYAVTFFADQLLGYGRLRRLVGTAERNN
jgi:radical SAM protein with 4Fe4S-binding SPASM domain